MARLHDSMSARDKRRAQQHDLRQVSFSPLLCRNLTSNRNPTCAVAEAALEQHLLWDPAEARR